MNDAFYDNSLTEAFAGLAKGDDLAFTSIYNNYFSKIFSTALHFCKIRELAEDITQQVFLVLWEERTLLYKIDNPEAWLWTITKNQALNRLKKEAQKKNYYNYLREFFEDEAQTPFVQLLQKQKGERIEHLVSLLSPRQQQIYRMNKYCGVTYKEIAFQLGLSKETVKEHMANALKNLKQLLYNYKDELLILLFFSF
ncbi:MAG: RNA polymerase sigma-70 factor [Sphingobacteriales bacterium]|jgi:RNA polymerase sigma-70 factor (family 1)|nr:RNA polymerase sigma-70 factor [Sphingobacteriales bacterium]